MYHDAAGANFDMNKAYTRVKLEAEVSVTPLFIGGPAFDSLVAVTGKPKGYHSGDFKFAYAGALGY